MNPKRLLTFWMGAEGESVLNHTATLLEMYKWDVLRAGRELRRTITPEIAAEAIEFTLLRRKAYQESGYGEWAQKGLFIRQSLEQSSSPALAAFHAGYFSRCHHVLELCTGLGFDTAALATKVPLITSVEANERLADMARYNLRLQALENVTILNATVEQCSSELLSAGIDGIWADPSRRTANGNRIYDPELYSPSLGWLSALPARIFMGIKVSPALNLSEKYRSMYFRQWIGFGAECREQILWRNSPVPDGTVSLVDKGVHWSPSGVIIEKPRIKKNGEYLVEPHNALIRSGYLADFYGENELDLLDPAIAYGISDLMPKYSPFYTRYRIVEILPFQRKNINGTLRNLGWGAGTIIKKRGFPETPEQIRRWLRFADSVTAGILFFSRVEDRHIVIFAEKSPQ